MPKNELQWYDLIGRENPAPQQLVRCDSYAAVLSLAEITNLEISCPIPLIRFAWELRDRQDRLLLSGTHSFPPEGVERFLLGEVLPLETLRPYETEAAEYSLTTAVTLATGHEVRKAYAFFAFLRRGHTAQALPAGNLKTRLEAIAVANAAMTGEQLRQICMDYMQLQLEFPFRLPRDYYYTVESQKRRRRMIGGKVYGGIPYVSRGAGNLYRIAEFYDPATGLLDLTGDIFDSIRLFGNACSGAASMAWARVVTSAYLGYTMFMTPANGFLPVGDYRYPVENLTQLRRTGVCCRSVCDDNGEQTMCRAYALLDKADGLVCDGHVRMNSARPVVIRREDGSIDPERSYTLVREQTCYVADPVHIRRGPDGGHYTAQGAVDRKVAFSTLFRQGYLPFTFREFADPTLVEPPRLRLAVEPELKDRVLSANYAISDVFLERGEKRWVYRNLEFFRKEVKLGDVFPPEALGKDTRIFCRLLNGQTLEVLQ